MHQAAQTVLINITSDLLDATHIYDALPVSALVDLTFDLETHYCPCGGQLSYQFWCFYRMFLSLLISQHLSDASRDLATLTLDLEVTALVNDMGLRDPFVYQVLNAQSFPFRRYWQLRIYCVSINRHGDFDL